MTRLRVGAAAVTVALLLPSSLVGAAKPQPKPDPPPKPSVSPAETRVLWKRDGAGRIEVTGSRKGSRLDEATKTLQLVADRLDALRTTSRHVKWSRLTWSDGRVQGLATADSALYGNVALLLMRDMFPGRSTAGSGIQQIRSRSATPVFRVRILVAPQPKSVKRTKPIPKPKPKP